MSDVRSAADDVRQVGALSGSSVHSAHHPVTSPAVDVASTPERDTHLCSADQSESPGDVRIPVVSSAAHHLPSSALNVSAPSFVPLVSSGTGITQTEVCARLNQNVPRMTNTRDWVESTNACRPVEEPVQTFQHGNSVAMDSVVEQLRRDFAARECTYQDQLRQAFERERATMASVQQTSGDPKQNHNAVADIALTFGDTLRSVMTEGNSNVQKLMTRQMVGRDLPTFSGRPEEWPLFAKMYVLTTEECGLSDSENLVRLQKALKDDARDAVLSMLTLPDNVGQVMRTLELRFGRNDMIIASVIQKVQALGAVKHGDFEGLIAFATAVQTVVSTMQLLKSDGHMFNPQLRQELVSKLPPGLRLQWGGECHACQFAECQSVGL